MEQTSLIQEQFIPDTVIKNLLEELRQSYLNRGYHVDSLLQPGLSREAILEITKQLPFAVPEDLIQLYSWRNGQIENSDWEKESLRFRSDTFISLEQALIEYDEFRKYYSDGSIEMDGFDVNLSLPFAMQDGSWYVIVCGPHQLSSPFPHPIASVHYSITLFYHSFESMLKTCIDWVQSPHWRESSDTQIQSEHEIWVRHNPGIFK